MKAVFYNSLKALCCILFISSLIACSGIKTKSVVEQTREQQQIELATLLDRLWQRAHIIPTLQQGAPLISTAKAGQKAIAEQNQHNIRVAKAALSKLDQALVERKQQPSTGDLAVLTAVNIRDAKQQTYHAEPLTLFRSEKTQWRLMNAAGQEISLSVVWNEEGNLYIEGQDTMDLSPSSPDTPITLQVFYYAGKVLAQASLTLELQAKVPRLG
ncbi:hypothetical protein [Marinomonas gallaica]|uniref:hypothetical protein n=1 Tax=Marinomonas gallaica TaxID=1806667 RepID=UPI000B11E9E0|nr:hypothetical protein [Marinomonas gallaica]